jgi:hypothetical protein
MPIHRRYLVYYILRVELVQSHIQLSGPDEFGRISDAWIKVKARMKIVPRLLGIERDDPPSGYQSWSNKSWIQTRVDGTLFVAYFDHFHPAPSNKEWCYLDLGQQCYVVLMRHTDDGHDG